LNLRLSHPGHDLSEQDKQQIEKDLEKIDRHLSKFKEEVTADVRISNGSGAPQKHVVVELNYGPNHLVAKADHADWGQAVREAREELLRQIKNRSRGGHSSQAKHS
jgi:ribosome-associated translation inhibitor RaiA